MVSQTKINSILNGINKNNIKKTKLHYVFTFVLILSDFIFAIIRALQLKTTIKLAQYHFFVKFDK